MNAWHPSLADHGWEFRVVVITEYPKRQTVDLHLPPVGVPFGAGVPLPHSPWEARVLDGYRPVTLPAYEGKRYGHAKYRDATPDEEAVWRLSNG